MLGSATAFALVNNNNGVSQINNHYDTNADRHVIVYDYKDYGNRGYAFSVETTGSTMTAGSLFEFCSNQMVANYGMSSCFDSTNNRTIVQWIEHTSGAGNPKFVGLICNTSTGAITASGSIKTSQSTIYASYSDVDMVFEPTNGIAYFVASGQNNGYYFGNYWQLSYDSSSGQYDTSDGPGGSAYSYNGNRQRGYWKLAIFGNDLRDIQIVTTREWVTNSDTGVFRIVTTVGNTNFTSNKMNFLGFAEDAISDGNTGTIKLTGNVVSNLSGLTAGTTYRVQDDGTFNTNWDARDVGVLALSSSSGLIMRRD